MYTLTVVNKFQNTITVDAGVTSNVMPGETYQPPTPLGDGIITVDGIGQLLLHDVGDRQIGGWSKATWGVFLAYQGQEAVFRYEGGGQLTITFNEFGQAQLESNGAIAQIAMSPFVFPGQ